MSNLERLMAEGAYSCAGSLVRNNVELGLLRGGDLHLTDAGRALLAKLNNVTDVVAKPARGRKKAEVIENVVTVKPAADDAEAALDALLGE